MSAACRSPSLPAWKTAPASGCSGEGEAGVANAPAGDLYVHVSLRPHPIFQRDGANVFCRVPLRMSLAALGGEVEVPAIDGSKARVKIPSGTQTGEQFRLRSKGFSVLHHTPTSAATCSFRWRWKPRSI